jgi:hypothetical protein
MSSCGTSQIVTIVPIQEIDIIFNSIEIEFEMIQLQETRETKHFAIPCTLARLTTSILFPIKFETVHPSMMQIAFTHPLLNLVVFHVWYRHIVMKAF